MPPKRERHKEHINTDIFIHHSQLFWSVTSIFTAVVVGLLTFSWEKNILVLNIFGFILNGILVYFATSFRLLKQNAMAEAFLNEEMVPNSQHLDQWVPYLLIWWGIGVLYIWNSYIKIKPTKTCAIALIVILLLWSGYVSFMGAKYNQSKKLRLVMLNKELQDTNYKNK